MDEQEFESWFVPSPRRLKTLNNGRYILRYLAAELFVIAVLMGLLYLVLK